jgi:hypothetical protein
MTTTMETPAYKKLVALAKRLGGRIVPTDGPWEGDRWETFSSDLGRRGWSTAPFCANIGVYWAKKVIAHKKVGFSTAGLVHEMGHVFASKTPPNNKHTDEVDFLGWEVTLAARLGIRAAWVREMSSYGIHYDNEDGPDQFAQLGDLTRKERANVLARAVTKAQQLGSLGPNLEIRSIRN